MGHFPFKAETLPVVLDTVRYVFQLPLRYSAHHRTILSCLLSLLLPPPLSVSLYFPVLSMSAYHIHQVCAWKGAPCHFLWQSINNVTTKQRRRKSPEAVKKIVVDLPSKCYVCSTSIRADSWRPPHSRARFLWSSTLHRGRFKFARFEDPRRDDIARISKNTAAPRSLKPTLSTPRPN